MYCRKDCRNFVISKSYLHDGDGGVTLQGTLIRRTDCRNFVKSKGYLNDGDGDVT